ncbi:TolC family protein [Bacteriovoracaceae bacterium]|nr:TolC family protein [Bacteriovoracaceae bacterium]
MKNCKVKYYFLTFIISLSGWAKQYTYESLLNLAKKNSINQEIYKTKVIEIDGRIDHEKSSYYPKLKAIIGSEKIDSGSEPDINESNFVGEIRLDYNLYRFGGTKDKINSLNALKSEQIKVSEFENKNLERKLEKEYLEGLYFNNYLQILISERKFNSQLKKQVSLKRRQGLVGEADVLEIDMREATLKDKILQNEEHFQHTLDNIRKLTFLTHEENIEISGELPHEHFDVKIDELVQAAYKKNLELNRLFSRIDSINYELNAKKSDRLPEVNLRARYGKMRIDERYTSNESLEGLVGIYVDIPLFDGGMVSSQNKVLISQLAREKLTLTKSKKNLKIDVLHHYEKMQNVHKQVDLAEANVSNGEKYFKNVLSEYKRGVKNSIDLVSARDRLMNFKFDLISAKRNFLFAKINLEEVVGVSF